MFSEMRAPILHRALPHRLSPAVWALGVTLSLFLAACGGGSSGCGGGGSGYQVDGVPGLLSCGGSGSSSGAGSTTDVTNLAMVAQNTGFNGNADFGVFYPMQGTANTTLPMPAAGIVGGFALAGGLVHPHANPNDYVLTSPTPGYHLYCEIAGGGLTYFDPTYSLIQSASSTLRVNFPTFTGTGNFTISCLGQNNSGNTQVSNLTVQVP